MKSWVIFQWKVSTQKQTQPKSKQIRCKMIIFFLKVLCHPQTTPTTIQTAIAEHKQYQYQQEWKWEWSSRISIQNRVAIFWQSEMGTEQHWWLEPVVPSPTCGILHWRVEQILCISTLSQMAVARVLVGTSYGWPYSHHRWVAIKYKSHLYKPNLGWTAWTS